MTDAAVLDASALLAFLRREPGRDRVAAVLGRAQISAVNLAEVCHLQRYLAQSCTAIRPRSCSAIWHQSTVDSLLMSPQTMTEVLHRGTRGPADDQRAIALDRSQSLLPDRKEGMTRAHLA
jgi:hypothetical protein